MDARRDDNLVIIARSEAKDSLQERLERTQACIEAGADASWVSARTEEEIVAYAKLGKPLVGVPPRADLVEEGCRSLQRVARTRLLSQPPANLADRHEGATEDERHPGALGVPERTFGRRARLLDVAFHGEQRGRGALRLGGDPAHAASQRRLARYGSHELVLGIAGVNVLEDIVLAMRDGRHFEDRALILGNRMAGEFAERPFRLPDARRDEAFDHDLGFRRHQEIDGLAAHDIDRPAGDRTRDGKFVEIIELPTHPWYVAVQFHPEFKSKPLKPHPLFAGFVEASYKHKVAARRHDTESVAG